MKVKKRRQAIKDGDKYYISGKPCKRGHTGKRYVSSYMCCRCGTLRAQSPKRKAYNKRRREHDAAWRKEYNRKNKEKVRALLQARVWKNRKKFLAKCRKYYKENRKRLLETRLRSNEKHREEIKKRNNEYYKKYPDKRKAIGQNTRAKRAKAKGSHDELDVLKIYKRQKGKCAYCKTKVDDRYHVDHRKPLCRGGSNWPRNLQITCQPCNQRKSYKTHQEFLKTTYYKRLNFNH